MKVKKHQPTLALKPTQFSVGILEAEYKVKEMQKLSTKRLQKLVEETLIPVIVSPWKELCVTDHHHFLFACWHANVKKVRVTVIKDYSNSRLSYHQFWRRLTRENKAYLYDQFGNGPHSPLYLPLDIRGLADDPYRSLAWMIRKEGAFDNSDQPFAEFQWADLFRKHKLLEKQGRNGYHEAIRRGARLACSKEARGLPGFRGASVKKKIERIAKSDYVPRAKKTGELATKPQMKK